jgi:hypothetical protein
MCNPANGFADSLNLSSNFTDLVVEFGRWYNPLRNSRCLTLASEASNNLSVTNTKNHGSALSKALEFVSCLTPEEKSRLLLALQGRHNRLSHPGEGVERWQAAMKRRLTANTIRLYKRTICEVLGLNCITVFDTSDTGLTVKGKPRGIFSLL